MKSTSSLSILLLLHLTSAAPIPILHPAVCEEYFECKTHFAANAVTPFISFATPHFPAHQLAPPWDSGRDHLNNAPITPPEHVQPSTALAADSPLTTSYLLSLADSSSKTPQSKPTMTDDGDFLPSKPTSALPDLRQEDLRRYHASLHAEADKLALGGDVITIPASWYAPCARKKAFESGSAYLRVGQRIEMARDHSDLLVVGIVILFLVIVVVLELVQKIGEMKRSKFGRKRGYIFLQEDETVAFIVKKPFNLQPAPPRYNQSTQGYKDEGSDGEEFHYDIDAFEKV